MLKANEEQVLVGNLNERNSLITMLTAGQRLDKSRSENSKNRGVNLYPPMDTQFQPIRNRARHDRNSLDTTFHATSHLLEQALSLPVVDSINYHKHDSENKIFIANGIFTENLVNSFNHQLYTSIDMSNIRNTNSNNDQYNASFLCFNIGKNCSQLQSLSLHNCQIDDRCVKALVSILTSKSNTLKSLNLSKNIITDDGAKTLLDAMKSQHCIVEELDLSQNQLTLDGISSFAEGLSNFLFLKVLHLADSEHLIPLSIFRQFSEAIEKNVVLKTLTLGSEIMDCIRNEANVDNIIEKKQRIDDVLLCYWHEPLYTAVTDHIRALLQQNYLGIDKLMCTSRIDVIAIQNFLNTLNPEQELDACFRLLRLRPDILLAVIA